MCISVRKSSSSFFNEFHSCMGNLVRCFFLNWKKLCPSPRLLNAMSWTDEIEQIFNFMSLSRLWFHTHIYIPTCLHTPIVGCNVILLITFQQKSVWRMQKNCKTADKFTYHLFKMYVIKKAMEHIYSIFCIYLSAFIVRTLLCCYFEKEKQYETLGYQLFYQAIF